MKNLYAFLFFLSLLFSFSKSIAQTITPLIYPQYSTDSSTGGRLPYVFRAKITGLTANTLYRYFARGASLAIDGNNNASGNAVFIRPTGNFSYTNNPAFGGIGGFDTMRTNAQGEVTNWFAFEPVRGNTSRFTEGYYIHARVFILNPATGTPQILTITDSIQNIRIDTKNTSATGVYSTSLAQPKDLVFLYGNTAGTGRPLTGSWIETDGLNFKSGTGVGGSPNATTYPAYYKNEVDTVTSAWGSYIPNNLSTGLLRIERRKLLDGTIAWSNTDADGIWDFGSVNTINANGGLSALNISTNDAPLISVPPTVYFTNATQTTTENAGTATISVALKFPDVNPTSVDIVATGIGASSTTDYTYTTQTITFPANSVTPKTVSVTILNDAAAESLENIVFSMANLTNSAAIGSPANDTLTIIDDDAPFVSFSGTAASGMETTSPVNIPVTIQFPNANATSVNIAVTGGTATLGTDYTFSNQTITFPASSSTPINVPLTILDDAITENSETIIFTLSTTTNGAVIGTSVYTYTINDNDITPILSFVKPTLQQIKENGGSINVRVQLTNPALTATSITVSAFGGTATSGIDYNLPSNTLTFPANTSSILTYSVPITDDNMIEGNETIILRLTNPSNNVTYTYEYDTINIIDNDLPVYMVSQINKVNGLGIADSLTVRCELRGVIYGPNVRPTGYQLLMNDRTGGIQIYRAAGNFGYQPQDKDSVVVRGEIQQVSGELQITNLDTIFKVGTGTYITPTVITDFSETNEGNYVTLQYCHLLNPAQWPTGTGTATVTIVDQNNKRYQTVVNRQTDIDSTPASPYWFHITGFLAQSDISLPWDTGYYLIPLSLQDYNYVYPQMSFTDIADTTQENIGLDSVELDLQWVPRTATSATVAFTGGTATYGLDFNFTSATITYPGGFAVSAKQKIGVIIIDDALPETAESIVLSILGPTNNATAVNPITHNLIIQFNDGVGNGINKDLKGDIISVYPNPGHDQINISSDYEINSCTLISLDGREVTSSNTSSLNLATIAKGVYILKVVTQAGVITRKIIVE